MVRIIFKFISVFALFPLVVVLLMSTCSEIGKQPAELWSARFTEDGRRLVYTYDVFTVYQYSKKGGSIQRSGSRKGYMNVRDAATGRLLLAEPYQSSNTLKVAAVIGDLCALSGYNIKKSRHELSIVDLTTGKERFGPEELSRINGGLRFDPNTYYENLTLTPGFVFAAEDARTYLIDPQTGNAVPVEAAKKISIYSGERNPTSGRPFNAGVGFTGQHRKKLEMNGLASKVDFIDPSFAAELKNNTDERDPVIYQGNPIIISRSTTENDFSWVITMLDAKGLELLWTASVIQVPGVAPFYNTEPLFRLNGEDLLVQTSTQLSQFDAATGKLNWAVQVP